MNKYIRQYLTFGLILLGVLVLPNISLAIDMNTIIKSYPTGTHSTTQLGRTSSTWTHNNYESLINGQSGFLCGIKTYIQKVGSPTDNIKLQLYINGTPNNNTHGQITGTLVTSKELDGSTATTSGNGTEYNFAFDNCVFIQKDATYYALYSRTGTYSDTNNWYIHIKTTRTNTNTERSAFVPVSNWVTSSTTEIKSQWYGTTAGSTYYNGDLVYNDLDISKPASFSFWSLSDAKDWCGDYYMDYDWSIWDVFTSQNSSSSFTGWAIYNTCIGISATVIPSDESVQLLRDQWDILTTEKMPFSLLTNLVDMFDNYSTSSQGASLSMVLNLDHEDNKWNANLGSKSLQFFDTSIIPTYLNNSATIVRNVLATVMWLFGAWGMYITLIKLL